MPTFHTIMAPTDEHLSAIGRVALQWNFVEKNLELLIWEMAPLIQPKAQAVTTHLSNQLLIDMAKSLVHEAIEDQTLKDTLRKHLDYISNDLRPKRNRIIHGIWGPTASADKIALLETTARGRVKFRVGDEMTANDILEIASEIDEANFQLSKLIHDASTILGQVETISTTP